MDRRLGATLFAIMPRYFFSVEDGRKISEDEGEDLANDEAARATGLEIARDLTKNNDNPSDLRVVIRRDDGTVVCEIPLKKPPR
jgi:hypothetical protein